MPFPARRLPRGTLSRGRRRRLLVLGGGFELRAVDAARSLLALHQHLSPRARPLAVGAPALLTLRRVRCCCAPWAERMRAHLLSGLHNRARVPYTRGIQLLHALVCSAAWLLSLAVKAAERPCKACCEAAAVRVLALSQGCSLV